MLSSTRSRLRPCGGARVLWTREASTSGCSSTQPRHIAGPWQGDNTSPCGTSSGSVSMDAASPAAQAAQHADIPKPVVDKRSYRAIRLSNGARFVLVRDPEVVFAAAAINVQVGYMWDPPEHQGLAHLLEHAVHLGSDKYPGSAEYKAWLAKHGGASNASTGMVHTVYHQKVHHEALEEGLDRLAQFFVSPTLHEVDTAQEMEVVHAEYSRNCNSDDRQVLQLRRAVCVGPYAQFSTGNKETLREGPAQLRQFWTQHYTADRICGCVVAPQTLETLEQWVVSTFTHMRPSAASPAALHATYPLPVSSLYDIHNTQQQPDRSEAAARPSHGSSHTGSSGSQGVLLTHPVAAPGQGVGVLLRISPQRAALRSLKIAWLIPHSPMRSPERDVKPWRWVGHLLGHEGVGSLAAGLKEQGLVTGLDVGVGDEVRMEPGFMWWGVDMQLTEAGLARVPELVVAVYLALSVVRGMGDADRERTYRELAEVAELRWHYADRQDPKDVVRELSARHHYWCPDRLLSGPSLLLKYDSGVLDEFLSVLVPSNMQVVVCAAGAAGPNPETERWYGARYTQENLSQELMDACNTALQTPSAQLAAGQTPLPVLPPCLPQSTDPSPSASPSEPLVLPPLTPPTANWALPVDTRLVTLPPRHDQGVQGPPESPPTVVRGAPRLRMWHKQDTFWELPKAHVYLRLVTPLSYQSPTHWVIARLIARLLEDRLQTEVYDAQIVGTSYSFSATEHGFTLHAHGFSSVVVLLLRRVLHGLVTLADDMDKLAARHPIIASKLAQQLRLWRHNTPLQHAEYAATHLMQFPHWHAEATLDALTATTPTASTTPGGLEQYRDQVGPQAVADFLHTLFGRHPGSADGAGLTPSTGSGPSAGPTGQLFVEGLCYGNMSSEGAQQLADMVSEVLLSGGGDPTTPVTTWPQLQLYQLLPKVHTQPVQGPVLVRHVVDNPNPSNTNTGLLYLCQVCDERDPATSVLPSVLLSLLVSVAAKPAFHTLRTQQRLGYVVSLSTHRHLGVLSLQVRVQSPEASPALIRSRLRDWLQSYREQLASMTEVQLAEYVSALVSQLEEPPRSLEEAASRCWTPISTCSYAFDRRQQKLAVAKSGALTPAALLQFYDAHVLPCAPPAAGTSATSTSTGNGAVDDTGPAAGTDDQAIAGMAGARVQLQRWSRSLACEVWGRGDPDDLSGGVDSDRGGNACHVIQVAADGVRDFQGGMEVFPLRPQPPTWADAC